MPPKAQFAIQVRATSAKLAQAANEAATLVAVYFDRGYNGGSANAIVDKDVADHNTTAADIAAFITLAQQLARFLNNAAVVTADYKSTVNKTRGDV